MIYKERIGDIETTYEGTPQEIMDLHNRIEKEVSKEDLKKLIDDDVNVKERYDNMKHFDLMPSGAILNKTYKATGIGNLPRQIFEPVKI